MRVCRRSHVIVNRLLGPKSPVDGAKAHVSDDPLCIVNDDSILLMLARVRISEQRDANSEAVNPRAARIAYAASRNVIPQNDLTAPLRKAS